MRGDLHGILDQHIAALGARNSTPDQDQAALNIGREHGQVLRGHPDIAHVTSHFLTLPNPARLLAVTRGTVRTVRNRHTVRGAQPGEVMPFHRAREAFTDRRANHIDPLTVGEMVGQYLRADIDHRIRTDPEFRELSLWLDLRFGEMPTHLLAGPFDLGGAHPELKRGIAVSFLVALGNDLAVIHLQHGDGNVNSLIREHPGHSDLPSDQSTTHWIVSWPRA